MTETPTTPGAPAPSSGATSYPGAVPRPPKPPLRRSLHDRKVAGVCGGLGRQLGLDPLLFRVLVAVLCVAGGAGVLLYGLAWLLVPEDGENDSEGEKLLHGRADSGSAAAVAVVVLGFAVSGGFLLGRPGSTFTAIVIILVLVVLMVTRRQPEAAGAGMPGPLSYGPPPPAGNDPYAAPGAGAAAAAYGPPPGYGPGPGPGPGYPPGPVYGPGTGTAYAPPGPPRPVYAPPPPMPPRERSFLGLVVLSIGLLTGAVLTAADLAGASIGPRVVLASVLLVLGLGMVLGAFVGRALWLLLLALPLSLVLGVVAAVEPTVGAGTGNPEWAPSGPVAVQSLDYRLGAGRATLDLTQVRPTGPLRITARVGAGQLVIRVPAGLAVTVVAHSGVGEVLFPGDFQATDGVSVDRTWSQGGDPQVTVDADITFGNVEVRDAQA